MTRFAFPCAIFALVLIDTRCLRLSTACAAQLSATVAYQEVGGPDDQTQGSPVGDVITISNTSDIGTLTSLSITPFYGRFTVYGDKGWAEVTSLANVDRGQPTHLTEVNGSGRRAPAASRSRPA